MAKKETSPVPKKREKAEDYVMRFPEAMQAIIEGFKVARTSWPEGEYALLKNTWLMIYRESKFFTWTVADADMMATDWVKIK